MKIPLLSKLQLIVNLYVGSLLKLLAYHTEKYYLKNLKVHKL